MPNFTFGEDPNWIVPYLEESDLDNNDLYLAGTSWSDRVWDKHRANSDIVAAYYRGTEFNDYAIRIDDCSQVLNFKLVLIGSESRFKLQSARFCRVRYCPVCQWRRSLMWKAKAYKILPTVLEIHPKHRWLFLTLTVRNCEIFKLRKTLEWMNKSWYQMIKRKKFPSIGWIRSIEITRSKDNTCHPHFHCLLLVKYDYFSKNYLKQYQWVKLWKSSLKIDYDPIVDIRVIKSYNRIIDIVPEILKYSVKELDLVSNKEWFLELTRQMFKLRAVSTGGILKDYLKVLEREPEDLIGKRDVIEEEIEKGSFSFNWNNQDKRYVEYSD